MIAVIADDFTGAAEISGIGLRYGMRVKIELNDLIDTDADLLVIATDTRSMHESKAYEEVYSITRKLIKLHPDWIYKKIDSVLRGNVLRELLAFLKATDRKRALLIPANPSNGRKIINGLYIINNTYLHKTKLANDPDFPIPTSKVLELMGDRDVNVSLIKPDKIIDRDGIYIGEAANDSDINSWAHKINNDIVPVGAASFFDALLEVNGFRKLENYDDKIVYGDRFLFVCGSSLSYRGSCFEGDFGKQFNVHPMPEEIFYNSPDAEQVFQSWKKSIIKSYSYSNIAVVTIDKPIVKNKNFSLRLRERMALVVNEVMKEVHINELIIDGGSTAYAITRTTGLSNILPIAEIAPGVIRLVAADRDDLFVTIKPGSYSFPTSLLESITIINPIKS